MSHYTRVQIDYGYTCVLLSVIFNLVSRKVCKFAGHEDHHFMSFSYVGNPGIVTGFIHLPNLFLVKNFKNKLAKLFHYSIEAKLSHVHKTTKYTK